MKSHGASKKIIEAMQAKQDKLVSELKDLEANQGHDQKHIS
jgi:hypothetical protein